MKPTTRELSDGQSIDLQYPARVTLRFIKGRGRRVELQLEPLPFIGRIDRSAKSPDNDSTGKEQSE